MTTGVGAVDTSGPARLPTDATQDPDGTDTPDISPAATPTRRLVRLAAIAVAYYLGARLGLSLSLVGNDVTPLWPPTGVAVAALVVFGRSYWPAVAVAALAVNLPISANPLAAAVTAVGNTLAPVVAVTLLLRVGFRRQARPAARRAGDRLPRCPREHARQRDDRRRDPSRVGLHHDRAGSRPRGRCGGPVTRWASSPSRRSCCACRSSGSSAAGPCGCGSRP